MIYTMYLPIVFNYLILLNVTPFYKKKKNQRTIATDHWYTLCTHFVIIYCTYNL